MSAPVHPPEQPTASPSEGTEGTLARPRVLVADDELGTLALMTDMLTYSGFDVTQARDGLEALVRAREAPPDLILLDVMMPGLDGREVCRRITSDPALAGVPVILHSSADEADVDWRAAGAGAFLQKPFPMRRLADIVRRILRGPHGME